MKYIFITYEWKEIHLFFNLRKKFREGIKRNEYRRNYDHMNDSAANNYSIIIESFLCHITRVIGPLISQSVDLQANCADPEFKTNWP